MPGRYREAVRHWSLGRKHATMNCARRLSVECRVIYGRLMLDLDDRIAIAARHVANGRRIVAEQQARVARGEAGAAAFELLRTFEQSLQIFEADLARLFRERDQA